MMELSQAKKFLYKDYDNKIFYISRDFWKLMNKANNLTSLIMAICDTPAGEQIFEMDTTYEGEPYIWDRFIHLNSFIGFHNNFKIIKL